MMSNSVKGARIFVGLSGGVDSAVTAALLKDQGAQVTGVFIKGWYPPGMPCTWAQDRQDAMRVAAHLNIPFATLDASAEYKKGVIDYLLAEYARGRTPNPDVMCNKEVKFGAFHAFALAHGATHIATGHYARTEKGPGGLTHLLQGVDAAKDQSYFLWAIQRAALAQTLFPLGALHKSEVRHYARRFALPVAEKKDSQGVCFLGTISVDDFLRSELAPSPGKAHDEEGKEIGMHDGAVLYTLGERVALTHAPAGPWYVRQKNLTENRLAVSHFAAETQMTIREIRLADANWFSGEAPDSPLSVDAQYRYHGDRISGTIEKGSLFRATDSLTERPAPGQSLVFYREDECIGGAIIV